MAKSIQAKIEIWVAVATAVFIFLAGLFVTVVVLFEVPEQKIGSLILTGIVGFGLGLMGGLIAVFVEALLTKEVENSE